MKWKEPALVDQQHYPPQQIFEAGLRHHHIANTAYPINHNWTMKPYRVWAESRVDVTLFAHSDSFPLRVQGAGVTTLTFLNPLKR